METIYKKLKNFTLFILSLGVGYVFIMLDIWSIINSVLYTSVLFIGMFTFVYIIVSVLYSDTGTRLIKSFYGIFIDFEGGEQSILRELKNAKIKADSKTTPQYVGNCKCCGAPRIAGASKCEYCRMPSAMSPRSTTISW